MDHRKAKVRRYGKRLTVRLCSRPHMVCLKMWAAVHRGEPDMGDLIAMGISEEEARVAAEWCLQQDGGILRELTAVLEEVGHGELAGRIREDY